MFKIDKRKATSFACAFAFASSLCLVSCGDKKDSEYRENGLKYVSVEEAKGFALNYNDGVSIIIPYDSCRFGENSIVYLDLYNDDKEIYGVLYGSSDLMFIGDYESTYNYACAISKEIYLYSDVIDGNPTNLLSDNNQNNSVKSM